MSSINLLRSFSNSQMDPFQTVYSGAYLRERYPSFNAYVQDRLGQNAPIDLIVGRGTQKWDGLPELHPMRSKDGVEFPYHPFTVDLNPNLEPDLALDVLKLHNHLPSCSVDEIYLENLFPPIHLDVKMYYAAAQVLKIGGELIIDYNEGRWDESLRKEQALIIKNALLTLGIPLELSFVSRDRNECQRNNVFQSSALKCKKVSNFDGGCSADLFNRAQDIIDRWNFDIDHENTALQKAICRSRACKPIAPNVSH